MALDQVGGEVGHPGPPGASDAVAIVYEEPVGHDRLVRKLVHEILIVVPAYAAPAPLHQADSAEDEAAGAEADQRDAGEVRPAQITGGDDVDLRSGVKHTPHHHHIVQVCGVYEAAGGAGHHPATGANGRQTWGHDRPLDV